MSPEISENQFFVAVTVFYFIIHFLLSKSYSNNMVQGNLT